MTQETPAELPQLPLKSKLPILGGTVLISEVIIVYFALLVGYGLQPLPFGWLVAGAVVLGALCIIATATLPKKAGQKGLGIALGWMIQLLILASGIVLGGLVVVAVVFGAMWAVGIYWGRRIDREATAYVKQAYRAGSPASPDNQEKEE